MSSTNVHYFIHTETIISEELSTRRQLNSASQFITAMEETVSSKTRMFADYAKPFKVSRG